MVNDGKGLEELVRQIEALLLPEGVLVSANSRIYNDEGIQIAEFDIEIRGRFGSTDINWLIECRDRPGKGAAPGSWIQQLIGRRSLFGYDKVTAVSTTGFTEGAMAAAQKLGIELRTVEEITAADVGSWLGLESIDVIQRNMRCDGFRLIISEQETPERIAALASVLQNNPGIEMLLRSTETHGIINGAAAFQEAVENTPGIFDDIEPNGTPKTIQLHVSYPNDASHYVVSTDMGDIRIIAILFNGELSITQRQIPIATFREYRRSAQNEPISQTASASFDIADNTLSVEFHQLADTGEVRAMFKQMAKPPAKPEKAGKGRKRPDRSARKRS